MRRGTGSRRAAGGEQPGDEREACDSLPAGRAQGDTLSAERIPLLVASAARIAAPTPRAPGILDWARMLSRCNSVKVSELPALELLVWLAPHPNAMVKSSGSIGHQAREIMVAPLVL
jgi:hypothetical protein